MKANIDRVMELVEENECGLSYYGVCLACAHEQDGCEPDARKYVCDNCGASEVYGAEECLFML